MKISFGDTGTAVGAIAEIVGGNLRGAGSIRIFGVVTDSRKVRQGDLFVALRGENFDGNDYIAAARAAGAAAALCERVPSGPECDCALILVDDTLQALGRMAGAYRRQVAPVHVAAVTGSVGKTTTKQLIYSVLSRKYRAHKTEGNLNNQIGLPLSVLAMPENCEAAVFELGMSARGEISTLSKIVEPDIAVITCVGTSHIEYLGSRENIRDAKLEVLDGLRPGGSLILNGDDDLLAGIDGAVYVSSKNRSADYFYTQTSQDAGGVTFDVQYRGIAVRGLYVPAPGKHIAADAALAFAAGVAAGVDEDGIREGLAGYTPTGMRQSINEWGGMTIIADCYNASPESMKAALTVLTATAAIKGGRSVAVLGDMLELGGFTVSSHREIGEEAARQGVDLLFTFGKNSVEIADGAKAAGMDSDRIYVNPDTGSPEATASALAGELRRGDTVLFKASRGTAIERVMFAVKGETVGHA